MATGTLGLPAMQHGLRLPLILSVKSKLLYFSQSQLPRLPKRDSSAYLARLMRE